MQNRPDDIKLAFDDVGRLEDELRLAKELQQSMLPKPPTTLDRFDIAATWLPANEMSGDFYDFIPIDTDRWGIVLGDVMGKGMPAAMVMSLARSALRMAVKSNESSQAVLNMLNQQLLGDMAKRTPVSLVYTVLDAYHQTLTIANAGIPFPLVLTPDGQCEEVGLGGFPLGSTTRRFDYTDTVIELKPNSTVVLYSDGIDEAQNPHGETYGLSRLPKILADKTDLSAQALVDLILEDTLNYTGNVRQDDMTLVVLKAKEAVSAEHLTENRAYQLVPESLRAQVRAEQGKIEGERCVVTLMTVDFSHLSAVAGDAIRQATDAIAQIIFKHKGLVNRVFINELSGFFGAPIRPANGTERGLLAAIEVCQMLQRLAEDAGVPLERAKVGLYTGAVVVKDVSDEWVEFAQVEPLFKSVGTLLGKTAPGEIWVDENTYRLTRADFDYALLPSVETDNLGRRLQPYRLRARRASAEFADPNKIFHRHEPQLRRLQACADALIHDGRGRIISIVGELGVGKRRLINAFRDQLGDDVMWVTSRCVPEKRRSSFAVFIPVLQRILGIDPSGEASRFSEADLNAHLRDALQKLRDDSGDDWLFSVDHICEYFKMLFLADYHPDSEIAALPPEQLQRQTFVAIRDVLAAAAHQQPIVLSLDDLNWIDDVSKNLITFIIDDFAHLPILLLCVSHSQGWWLRDQTMRILPDHYESVVIEALSLEESAALLDSLLPGEGVPKSLKTRVLRRANGNPFHLTQLVKLLQADGVLLDHDGEWLALADVNSLFIPNTLEGVLRARLDRLNINAREIMQYAAVLGVMASLDIVRQMANFIPHLDHHLQKLLDLGLIHEDESRYKLEGALVANIAYASIPQHERHGHHRWIARWLEARGSSHTSEYYELLAFHYSQTENFQKAAEYLIEAGHRARRCFNNPDAIVFYEQALDAIREASPDAPEQMKDIYEGLGEVFKATGRYADALTSYEKFAQSDPDGIDPVTQAQLSHRIAEAYIRQSSWDEAFRHLKSTEASLMEAEDWKTDSRHTRTPSISEISGSIYHHIGFVHSERGELTQAIEAAQNALSLLSVSDSPGIWARIHGRLGTYYTKIGDLHRAANHLQAGVGYADQVGNQFLLSVFYNDLGVIARALNRFDRAIEYYQKSIRIKKHLKYLNELSRSHFGLAQTYRETADWENARSHLREALKYSVHGSSDKFIADLHVSLASIEQKRGDIDAAIEHHRKNIEIRQSADDQVGVAVGQSHLCTAYLAKGDLGGAFDTCSTALELAGILNLNALAAQNYIRLAQIYRAQENWDAALENLEIALITVDKTEDGRLTGQVHQHLAETYLQSNQPDFAKYHFYEALNQFESLDARAELDAIQQTMEAHELV